MSFTDVAFQMSFKILSQRFNLGCCAPWERMKINDASGFYEILLWNESIGKNLLLEWGGISTANTNIRIIWCEHQRAIPPGQHRPARGEKSLGLCFALRVRAALLNSCPYSETCLEFRFWFSRSDIHLNSCIFNKILGEGFPTSALLTLWTNWISVWEPALHSMGRLAVPLASAH